MCCIWNGTQQNLTKIRRAPFVVVNVLLGKGKSTIGLNNSKGVYIELKRPTQTPDLLTYGKWIRGISDLIKDMLLNMLMTERDQAMINRILWMLDYSSSKLQEEHSERLIQILNVNDPTSRSLALQLVVSSGDATCIEHILNSKDTYNYKQGSWEAERCAWIYIHYGQSLSITELATRIPLEYVSYAVEIRGMKTDEVKEFTALVHTVWQNLSRTHTDDTQELPPLIVEEKTHNNAKDTWLSQPSEERTVTVRSASGSWGGKQSSFSDSKLKDLFSGDSDKDMAEQQRRYWETVEHLRTKSINSWWTASFDTKTLAQIDNSHPEFVDEWVDRILDGMPESDALLRRCNGFYQSLCYALVSTRPELGFRLWEKIRKRDYSVRFLDGCAGTDWITTLPFSADASQESSEARLSVLEECFSDIRLLELTTVALAYNQNDWLITQSQRLICMPTLWQRAKGICLCCLSDANDNVLENLIAKGDIEGTWVDKMLPHIREYHDRNKWAQHWYREFLKADDPDASWCAFRLFLKCVDRRWYTWVKKIENEFDKEISHTDWKIRFRKTFNHEIKKSIDKNEKKLKEVFLSIKFNKGELIPFE